MITKEELKEIKPIYVILPVIVLIVLVGGTIGIVNYQKNNKAPLIEIESPSENATLKKEAVLINGKTAPGAKVFVNDLELAADDKGEFFADVILSPGENKIKITAQNENGKKAEKELVVNYQKPVAKKKSTAKIVSTQNDNSYVTGKGSLSKSGPESLFLGEISIFSGAGVLWAATRKRLKQSQRKEII